MSFRIGCTAVVLFLAVVRSAGAQAHTGQPPSQHVTLELIGGVLGGCDRSGLDFTRTLPDGGSAGIFRIPAGQILVVTDVDWQYVHPQGSLGADKIETLRLFIENLADRSISRRAFESTVVLSKAGEGGTSEKMTSGFIVSALARVCPDVVPGPQGPPSGLQHLIVRGYLTTDF